MDQKTTRDFLQALMQRMQKDMRAPELKKKPELFLAKLRHYADMFEIAASTQKKPAKVKKAKKKKAIDEASDTVASVSPAAE